MVLEVAPLALPAAQLVHTVAASTSEYFPARQLSQTVDLEVAPLALPAAQLVQTLSPSMVP